MNFYVRVNLLPFDGAMRVNKLASPCPIRMLNIGPAIVAVTPISPNPFFVMAVSALISPKLLPQANTVRERRAYGSSVMNPKMTIRSTTQFEVQLIQETACKNAIIA
jgi:hypothetical protein